MTKIILASSSPRRQALLRQIDVPFDVIVSGADEKLKNVVSPHDFVARLSQKKAMDVQARLLDFNLDSAIIIAADTVVVLHGEIIGKPKDEADAFQTLKRLQGNQHTVYTGVTLMRQTADGGDAGKTFVDTASVVIRALADEEISNYIHTGEPFGKAGSYAIQGKGALLVEKIEGDYHTVAGLPLTKLYLALREWNFDLINIQTTT